MPKAQLLAARGSSGAGAFHDKPADCSTQVDHGYITRAFVINKATGNLKTPESHHVALPHFR